MGQMVRQTNKRKKRSGRDRHILPIIVHRVSSIKTWIVGFLKKRNKNKTKRANKI